MTATNASTLHTRSPLVPTTVILEPAVAKIPDKAQQQRQFMALEFAQRRAIIKAVNRGRAVETRAHAGLAVNVARRQQRFWRVAWLLGPIVGVIQFAISGLEAALVNGVVGTAMLGLLAIFWGRRAKRAEELNLALLGAKGGSGGGKASQGGGHLPGERPSKRRRGADPEPDASDPAAEPTDAGDAPIPGYRPYKERGRKRR